MGRRPGARRVAACAAASGGTMGQSNVLTRMVGNVALEALLGAVPFLGDLFDAAFKANVRNVRLLEQHLAAPGRTQRASTGWVVGLVVVLVGLFVLAGVLALLLLRALLNAL